MRPRDQQQRRLLLPCNARRGVAYEGLIATRCAIPNTLNNAVTDAQYKTGHVATDDIYALKLGLAAFWFNNDAITVYTAESPIGAATTVRASVEYPSGTRRQILWSGRPAGSIPNGSISFSDYCPVFIPRGATFWIHRLEVNAGGAVFCSWDDPAFNEGIQGGSGLADVTMSGSPPGRVAGYSGPPLAIVGLTRKPSVLIAGDSINAGYLASTTISDGRRGIVASGFPSDNSLAFLNISLADEETAEFLAGSNGTARRALFPYFSHMVSNYGFNDLNAGSKSNAQLQALLLQFYQLARANNPKLKITQCTLTPLSTSASGNWTSDGDQTVFGGTTSGTQYDHKNNFNIDLRAGNVAGVDNGYFDVAAYANSGGGPPANNGKWISDGTNKKYTTDGIHPTQAANDLISASAVNVAQLHYP